MISEQALEIAQHLTGAEGHHSPDCRAVARSLDVLLPPELGDTWAILDVQDLADTDRDPHPWLIVAEGEPASLWVALVVAADDPKYEWPKLMVSRYGRLNWSIGKICDVLHRPEGVERVHRTRYLVLGGDNFAFSTDERIVPEPKRSAAEQFGVALGEIVGWPVGAIQPDAEG